MADAPERVDSSVSKNNEQGSFVSNVSDFLGTAARSLAYSALQSPLEGVTEIVDHTLGTHMAKSLQFMDAPQEAKFGSANWHAQQIGNGLGMAFDFIALNKVVGGMTGARAIEGAAALSTTRAIATAGLSGALYGGVFRPVGDNGGNFVIDRLKNAATGGAVFGALTGASIGLRSFGASEVVKGTAFQPLLANKLVTGLAAGIPAGMLSAELESISSGKGLASPTEAMQSGYAFLVAGGAIGAAHGMGELVRPTSGASASATTDVPADQRQRSPLQIIAETQASRMHGNVDAGTGGSRADGNSVIATGVEIGKADLGPTENGVSIEGIARNTEGFSGNKGRNSQYFRGRADVAGTAGGGARVEVDVRNMDKIPGSPTSEPLIDVHAASDERFDPLGAKMVKFYTVLNEGPTDLKPSSNGKSEIFFDEKNQIKKITYTADMTPEQRKLMLVIGGFAQMIESDPEAYDAVARVRKPGMGFIPKTVEAWATPAEAQAEAVRGATAYITGETGNAFTQFLRNVYGDWTTNDTKMYMDLTNDYGRLNMDAPDARRGLAQRETIDLNKAAADRELLANIRKGATGTHPVAPDKGPGRPGKQDLKPPGKRSF